MAESPEYPTFTIDLGEYGGPFRFSSAEELTAYHNKEFSEWEWVKGGQILQNTITQHSEVRNQLERISQEWQNASRATHSGQITSDIFPRLHRVFETSYLAGTIFHSSGPNAAFIFQLKQERGDEVAAGAYGFLLGRGLDLEIRSPKFIEGMIEGFLHKREIDWTGSANQEVLNRLKKEYAGNLFSQETRLKEIEERNRLLNEKFITGLESHSRDLGSLHESKKTEFEELAKKHIENLEAIEKTYDEKLALQKPVEYWRSKERSHSTWAKAFGWSALAVGLLLAGGMGWLVHWLIVGTKPGDEPPHWQLGILVVAAFFAIWFVRVLLRLFFSNVHLASDAAGRRTMILTYLSMSREGSEFKPEDRTLIVQHLFRSASDGTSQR